MERLKMYIIKESTFSNNINSNNNTKRSRKKLFCDRFRFDDDENDDKSLSS